MYLKKRFVVNDRGCGAEVARFFCIEKATGSIPVTSILKIKNIKKLYNNYYTEICQITIHHYHLCNRGIHLL